jgi:hypothetical protein
MSPDATWAYPWIRPVGFQNRVIVCDLQRHGWLVTVMPHVRTRGSGPPRTFRRCTRATLRPVTAIVVWMSPSGGRRFLARGGRCRSEVHGVLSQDRAQVPRPGDEHPVGDLGPDGAHPAFGIRVHPRAARWNFHRLDPRASQHRVERLGELTGPEPELAGRSPRSISRFRTCCTAHAPSG